MQVETRRSRCRRCARTIARLSVLLCGCSATAYAQGGAAPQQYGEWNVGHQVIQANIDTGANRSMDIDVWFPTDADTSELGAARYGKRTPSSTTTMFSGMAFETDQAVTGQQFPLIVYSHGATGKSVDNSAFAESLASNGFVVASTTHLDGGVPLQLPSSSFERVQDVSSIIDVMFAKNGAEQDAFSGVLGEAAVGVAGHSFGGATALAMAGGIENETGSVPPDPRVRAIMPLAQGDPYGNAADLSNVDVPTLLFVGNQDEFASDAVARDDIIGLASTDKFLVIADGANHLDVGVSYPQQREVLELPAWGITLSNPYATEFSNGETLRLESLFGVSFFTEFLKGDHVYDSVLTPTYVAENELAVEFLDATMVAGFGDINADGEVNGLDVDPFVDVLLNGPYQAAADMNNDQVVNGLDVDPFVATVVGSTAQAQVPEPSTLLLGILALGMVAVWRKRVG